MNPDTIRRLDMLIHALGLDSSKKTYRNHYCAEPHDPDCAWLTSAGLFESRRNCVPTGGLNTWVATEIGKEVAIAFKAWSEATAKAASAQFKFKAKSEAHAVLWEKLSAP